MSTIQTIDIDALLVPISEQQPTGVDVRQDDAPMSRYRQVKDARHKARRQESQGIWDDDDQASEPADWAPVLREAPTLIGEQSKDLEVAAWLTEALIRQHGYAGLRDGFRLCRELVDRYWDDLYPQPDPDEPADAYEVPLRVAALAGLNGSDQDGPLVSAIKAVSLVDSQELGPVGLSLYQQAVALDKIEDANERAKRLEHGSISTQMFEKAVAESSASFFRTLISDLDEARQEFAKLCESLETRCGSNQAPPSSNIRLALNDCYDCVTGISRDILAADMPMEESGDGDSTTGGAPRVSGPIQSREQAFAVIGQVAQFFRQSEPHSVLAWQLEECIRWGRMSLPDLLADLIADGSAREQLFRRVGIPPPTET